MDVTLSDPARDVRDEVAAKSGVVEPLDKMSFHKAAAAVIEPERCVACAGCIAACPSGSIDVADDGKPTLVRMCTGCSSCWDFCPLAGLRSERLFQLEGRGNGAGAASDGAGPVRAAYYARAREPVSGAQDGGVVTALLAALLELGEIQGALVSRRQSAFSGQSVIATSAEEVREAAGSVYDQTLPLSLLARPLPDGVASLGLVGTPCQITVLRALQRFPWPYRRSAVDAVRVAIALFCTRSFDPPRLRRALAQRGVDPRAVARVDVREGLLSVCTKEGETIAVGPVATFAQAALRGCDECVDFGGQLADIAVGNCGSPPGFTTVIVRTAPGEEAWAAARGALEWHPLRDLGPVVRTTRGNRRRALRHLRRDFSPDGDLWVPYSEHLRAYAGSDRAPVPPPPHRTHHYQLSC